MRLIPVPWSYTGGVWPRIEETLKKAVDRNDGYTMEDVYKKIVNREMQLWLADDGKDIKGVAVTQILIYPRKSTCLLLFTAGAEWASWRHLLSDIEDWATQMGCSDFEFIGRRGWLKKDLDGYTAENVVFNKKLRG